MNGPLVAEIFSELGLDLDEAAQLLGVSSRTVRRWMDGDEVPGPAVAALEAWRQLHARRLAWKPDAISIFENDQAQIERARQHAQELDRLIKLVEARGGPTSPWTVSLSKGVATFGPFEVGFYRLANGGFSLSTYRRRDMSPDYVRDQPFLQDAAYSIQRALTRAAVSPATLEAVADYVRQHSNIFVVDGPSSLSADEKHRRQREIEKLANDITLLASAARDGDAEYADFEELLHKLHNLGFFPTIELVSAVAHAMI